MTLFFYLCFIVFLESAKCYHEVRRPALVADYVPLKHPMDPLNGQEIERTAEIIKKETNCIFVVIQLKEPPKAALVWYFLNNTNPPEFGIPRCSFTVCINKGTRTVIEYIVDLNTNKIMSRKELKMGVQPLFTNEDSANAARITKSDPEFLRRCSQYGYSNLSLVYATDWSIGYSGDKAEYANKRLCQMLVYGQQFKEDNVYAHPLPITVVVDLNAEKVLDILDCPTGTGTGNDNSNVTVPKKTQNYDPDILPPGFLRTDVKPVNISNPQGVSYTVNGYQIKWQKYSFRVGFNPREGLVLHWITYNDKGKVRPLIYRAAVSEMWIPYGDPRLPTGPMKSVFDEGEYGLGFGSLVSIAQEDCLGTVHFFDGYVNNNDGTSSVNPQCICVYEDDAGLLWKHQDEMSQKMFTVRSNRLVVSFSMQSGNYNYVFSWLFYQDATIEMQVKLTGIISTSLLAQGATPPPYGKVIAEQIFAQFHQHFFCVRMDVDIDGVENSAEMVDLVSPGPDSPTNPNLYGNAVIARTTPLKTAGEARTKKSPNTSRVWNIYNPNKINPIDNKPVSYMLRPENRASVIFEINNPALQGNFTAFDVWITQYNDEQIFANGDYLNGDGLPKWVDEKPDASLVNSDIVLWHVFGFTHSPRIEDWPIMTSESTSFVFRPNGFFTENPGMDVPNSHKKK